ncbi:MAG: metalloregulator ArsR/SmtB family transcription factor [Tannerellaceae bacterium]|jgi:DNA-binding transcriptional ArsR family regulator|nr:metalloregulator ArsR/SmtB family transcription factor [Tannerellaceae bacterium]
MAYSKAGHFDNKEIALARYAKALSHPARIVILRFLSKQSCCYCGDIVEVFPIAQSTVSQHLKELKNAGLIQGEINPPKVRYCIQPDNFEEAKRMFAELFK